MKNLTSLKEWIKWIILFIIFGFIYYVFETIFKYPNPSHWTMFCVGGIMGVAVGGLNEYLPWEMPLWRQCFYGGVLITFVEGISGLILNVWLGMNIWKYTFLSFFFDQCCIPFSLLWIFMSGLAIVLDDYLRYWLFGEEYPHYKFGCKS